MTDQPNTPNPDTVANPDTLPKVYENNTEPRTETAPQHENQDPSRAISPTGVRKRTRHDPKRPRGRPPAELLKNRCRATSKRTGKQCQQPARRGGVVCKHHGGNAPQTLAAARRRLLQLVEPAIDTLTELIAQTEHRPAQLGAANSLLDRAGLKPADTLKIGKAEVDLKDLSEQELVVLSAIAARQARKQLGPGAPAPDQQDDELADLSPAAERLTAPAIPVSDATGEAKVSEKPRQPTD